MPLLKPDVRSGIKPPLEIHMRKEGGLSICGLMLPEGHATGNAADVTCETCQKIMKARSKQS